MDAPSGGVEIPMIRPRRGDTYATLSAPLRCTLPPRNHL